MTNDASPLRDDGSSEHSAYPVEAGFARDAGIGHLGDILTAGDISGSNVAIGRGASIIVYEAQSRIKEIRLEEKYISEQVADAIGRQLSQYEQLAHKPIFSTTTNPYRALQSFDIEDAALFFGRQADIKALLAHLNNPITILRSASGAGKSSLLKAGVAARLLAAGHLPVYVRPFQKDPAEAIKAWFLYGMEEHPEMERVRREPLLAFLQRILELLPDPRGLIVFLIDQFEEFFYYLSLEEQQAFIGELERCRAQLSRRVRWIFAIRDDKFTELGAFCPPICLSFSDTYYLAWTDAQARETIIEPARQVGLSIDAGLPQQIVDDLTINERQLTPLHLQLICHTLFANSAQPSLNLSFASYRSLGAAQGILQSWLQRVLAGLPKEAERDVAQFALRELVNSQFHRIRRTRADLESACLRDLAMDRLDLGNVLSYLEANGLVLREGDGDTAVFELTHDFLAERIELDPAIQARKLAHEMLSHDLLVYQRNLPDRTILISADRLLLIENNLVTPSLSEEQQGLLRRSREKVEKESAKDLRKTRALLGSIIAILLVIIGGLGIWIGSIQTSRNNKEMAAAATLVPVAALGIRFEAHEVTNERYGACVEEGVCSRPEGFLEIEANWEESRSLPVVYTELAEALLFCQWIGRTLPTYEEWAAVAPPLEEWQTLSAEQALLCREESGCENMVPVPVPISKEPQYQPDNDETAGIYDLVGSVEEWTRTTVTDGALVDITSLSELFGRSTAIVVLGQHYRMPLQYVGAYPDFPIDSTDSPIGKVTRGFRCVE